MPRPNRPRTIDYETNLAARVAFERDRQGLTMEGLAKLMTDAGCSMQGSAIYRIESGTPRRRVALDEAMVLASVLGMTLDDLMTPIELVRQKRAREVAEQMPGAFAAFDDAVIGALRLYLEYGRLAADSPELLEYMNNHFQATRERNDDAQQLGVDLGDNVTEDEIASVQRDVLLLWGRVLRLASKAAGREVEV